MKKPFLTSVLVLSCLQFGSCREVVASAPAPERWEYKIVYASQFAGIHSFAEAFVSIGRALEDPMGAMAENQRQQEIALNRLGEEGWELTFSQDSQFYFKRRLQP